jgi:uncharacterized Zn-finger protein
MSSLFIPSCQVDLMKFNFDVSINAAFCRPFDLVAHEPANYFSPVSDSESPSSPGSVHSPTLTGIKYTHSVAGRKSIHLCKICHKLFERPSTLKTHMNSHTGERPYFCPNVSCNRSFSVRSNMNRHFRRCPL